MIDKKLGWLITAYQQVAETLDRIDRIKAMCPASQICVVTTSETDCGFQEVRNRGCWLIEYDNAPGSKKCNWFKSKSNVERYDTAGNIWRAQYLTARILTSIQTGLRFLDIHGCEYVLHIHSDTFFYNDNVLRDDIQRLTENNYLFIADATKPCEESQILPPGFCFQPEGTLFNLQECKRTGFWDFHKIYHSRNSRNEYAYPEDFYSVDIIGYEATFGSWAHYVLAERNVLDSFEQVDPLYYKKCIVRCTRNYHGDFYHLINTPGMQGEGNG